MSEEKTINEVYQDRNALAVGFCELARYLHLERPGSSKFRACWKPDDGDDADADEWAILYAWTPEGQVSWHVPRDLAEESNLPQKNVEWDGHTREEKNERLLSTAGI